MFEFIVGTIVLVIATFSVIWLKRHGKQELCSDFDYCYGNRFRIYRKENTFFIYDREFKTDISVYNKCMSFSSRKDAEEFLLDFGDLFACLENND